MSEEPLKIGDPIPTISFKTTSGQTHTFSDFAGQTVILYFYPKDDTPGCTIEAKGFRDHLAEFQAKNAIIFGVSKDTEASHHKFREKYCLPFDLIIDSETILCQHFGVLKDKSLFGKKYKGIERSTFIINPAGQLAKEWRKVNVLGHVKKVLEAL
ncbi:MAG: peroxiredoxin [Gammaproteobacteria bacterium]|jgi:peroxiredoxin Q/BCP|nr:peroxiredoxin [Gammaproteobacteria bacterium]